jgi:hypothetical protein
MPLVSPLNAMNNTSTSEAALHHHHRDSGPKPLMTKEPLDRCPCPEQHLPKAQDDVGTTRQHTEDRGAAAREQENASTTQRRPWQDPSHHHYP